METITEREVKEYISKCRAEGKPYSVEHLRRALHIGYKKAKRVFDEMEGLTEGDTFKNSPRKKRKTREVEKYTPDSMPPRASAQATNVADTSLDLGTVSEIVGKLRKHENAWPFNQPVDPIALNVPDYLQIVKNPMDLSTIEKKLQKGEYQDSAQVIADVELVWSNCHLYNSPDHVVCFWASELAEEFNRMILTAKRGRQQRVNRGIDISEVTSKRKKLSSKKASTKRDSKKRRKTKDDLDDAHDRSDVKWEERLAELKSYKERFGHCKVQRSWEENPQLGQWVHDMRQYRRKGILKQEREDKLNALGFVWSCRQGHPKSSAEEEEGDDDDDIGIEYDNDDSKWDERFALLQAFREKYGSCRVPKRYEEDLQLGLWVADMRHKMKRGELDEDRLKKLNGIGFVWNFQEEWNKNWEERFEQIKVYKAKWGHCTIPKNVPSLKQLAQWVRDVRKNRRKGKLGEDRIRKLEKIGFVWNPSKKRAITANGPPRSYETLDQLASLASEAELLEVEVEKEESESSSSDNNSPEDEEKGTGKEKEPENEGEAVNGEIKGNNNENNTEGQSGAAVAPPPETTSQEMNVKAEQVENEDDKLSAEEEKNVRLLGEWGSRIVEDKAADSDTESDDGKKRRKRSSWFSHN